MNLNLAPSPFPMDQTKEKEHDENQETFTFGLNHHHHHQIVSSSSSSASCHIFFNQAQDHAGFFHPQLYQPHHHPLQDDYYSYHRGSSYEIENKVEKGLKLSLWKKEDENMLMKESSSSDGVKWLMKKKKKKDEEGISMMNGCSAKMEVKKVNQSSSMETDLSSNSYSYNCSTPIRVCSDCHTTKTPLWRSGPKGPKSLCNACGIRQRKARRAMAAAAAGDSGGGLACDPMKVKVKVKMGKSGMKKRCKSGGELEEFLIRLSEKLAIHRVFPQDEKEAAILLMALSSGLVHG